MPGPPAYPVLFIIAQMIPCHPPSPSAFLVITSCLKKKEKPQNEVCFFFKDAKSIWYSPSLINSPPSGPLGIRNSRGAGPAQSKHSSLHTHVCFLWPPAAQPSPQEPRDPEDQCHNCFLQVPAAPGEGDLSTFRQPRIPPGHPPRQLSLWHGLAEFPISAGKNTYLLKCATES